IKQGRFREDLYYRLAVVTIRLPKLAERGDDLLLLTAFFIRQFAERYGKRITAISDRAMDLLRAHAWVGNVRELRNVIERGVIVANDDTLRAEHLPDEIRGEETALTDRPQGGLLALAEVEARYIARVLAHNNGQIGASTPTSCGAVCPTRCTASPSTCTRSARRTWRRSKPGNAVTRRASWARSCGAAISRRKWGGSPRRERGTSSRSAWRKACRTAVP